MILLLLLLNGTDEADGTNETGVKDDLGLKGF